MKGQASVDLPALEKNRGAIVYGHGLFTTGREDFNEAFGTLVAVESMCREKYFEKVRALRSPTAHGQSVRPASSLPSKKWG